MRALIVYLSDLLVLFGAMALGLFGPVGICAAIWGPEIMNTALGDPPIRSHPAFLLFITLICPSMIISAIGSVFCIILPLHIKTEVPFGSREKALASSLASYFGRLKYKENEK